MKSNPPESGRTAAGHEPYKRLGSGCPKKTRDLPNVSECQACGFRVDACAGKPRIRLLYSEWRVILLCKRCLVRVESSRICSYCFRDASMEDCVRCGQCGRSLHSTCFQQFKTVPVCSCNSIPGKEFLVCVDCWVPIPIARKRPVSKRTRVCQHGIGLKPGDMNTGGVGVHGNNVETLKSKEMGLRDSSVEKNAVQVDYNVLDDGCESRHYRNLHPIVSIATESLKPNLRVYERSKSVYGRNVCNYNQSAKNPEEKFIDRNETSPARCLNVYARNRWRSGKYLRITNGCFTKMEAATTTKGEESFPRRLKNVYARKRWKNGKVGEKQSCEIQKKEEAQERDSEDSVCTEKLNADSHGCNSRSSEPVALMDERERFSVNPRKVYARARLKDRGCTQNRGGDDLNKGTQPDVVEREHFHGSADSNPCYSNMKSDLRVCSNRGR